MARATASRSAIADPLPADSLFKILAEDGDARVGLLQTRHGPIRTPFFMTVATKGVGKFLASIDYAQMGAPALIANSFLLSLYPGNEHIRAQQGIHAFMNFKGVIFTDCGGFQMIREGLFVSTTSKGITFKNPYAGKNVVMTPALSMRIQQDIGADVAMMLDDLSPWDSGKERFEKSLENTHRWALESLQHHTDRGQLLFGIVQGGFFSDLRERSARHIDALEVRGRKFDGIAIGGVAIGEPQHKTRAVLETCLPLIGKDRPRYVMGVGTPEQLVEYVGMGIDCFDSIFPTKNARHRELFTRDGTIIIDAGRYKDDQGPIDPDCACMVCKSYTRSYLYYLTKLKDPTGLRLCSYHNVAFIVALMNDIQDAIEQRHFAQFKEGFLRRYAKNKAIRKQNHERRDEERKK